MITIDATKSMNEVKYVITGSFYTGLGGTTVCQQYGRDVRLKKHDLFSPAAVVISG